MTTIVNKNSPHNYRRLGKRTGVLIDESEDQILFGTAWNPVQGVIQLLEEEEDDEDEDDEMEESTPQPEKVPVRPKNQ